MTKDEAERAQTSCAFLYLVFVFAASIGVGFGTENFGVGIAVWSAGIAIITLADYLTASMAKHLPK